MGALSFNAVEILPSLLDKSKTQTIRPLFETKPIKVRQIGDEIGKPVGILYKDKKPRFKVGDKVKLYWKMRDKHKWWLYENRKGLIKITGCIDEESAWKGYQGVMPFCTKTIVFNKLLGEVEITEVFSDEFVIEQDGGLNMIHTSFGSELWERDGFKTIDDLGNWLDKNYDLSEPKRFCVYMWRWL